MLTLFVVISGLPGSGKTTFARRLAPALNLPLIDKDDILDRLFGPTGIGDAVWRRVLRSESHVLLRDEALRSGGAIVPSLRQVQGLREDLGPPTAWLRAPQHLLVEVHSACA